MKDKIPKSFYAFLRIHGGEIQMNNFFEVLERTLKSLQGFSFFLKKKKKSFIVQVLKCGSILIHTFDFFQRWLTEYYSSWF